jgi:PleD family two-component response regulator
MDASGQSASARCEAARRKTRALLKSPLCVVAMESGRPKPVNSLSDPTMEPPLRRSKRSVFVVDNERHIAFTLATILQQRGFDAFAFLNSLEALRAAQTMQPDLLISNADMPDLSGPELALQLREVYPKCKIVLFSGPAGTSRLFDVVRRNDHSFDLLMKPDHPTEI